MKNKIILLTIINILILNVVNFATIYEIKNEQNIAPGTTLTNIKSFTASGWLNLNILKIDTKNDYVSVNLLTAPSGAGMIDNVRNMVTNSGAIAGINADFFASKSGSTVGESIGFSGSNGNVIVSSAYENDTKDIMSSFILNSDNSMIYTYLKDKILLNVPKTGDAIGVNDINKYPANQYPNIYTPAFGENSIGTFNGLILTEMIVEDGIVKAINLDGKSVPIPKNGYVVASYGLGSDFLCQNFNIGDSVNYTIDISIDLSKIKFAVSGGAILLQNGNIPTFTHNISGTHPRTAIGSSADNRYIYLVTLDGRQSSSIGASQTYFAEILRSQGVYNAINLDGGGSTTMIARKQGDSNVSTINSPSDGYLRQVINGVGVFSTAPSTTISGLIVTMDDNLFVKDSKTFTLKGYDSNYNPVTIDASRISVSFSNNNASYSNGKITGLTVGKTTATIRYNGGTVKKDLNILGEIYSLEISPKNVSIDPNKTQSFSLVATDAKGFSSKLDNSLVTWKVTGSGTISNGIYTAPNSGAGIVSATIDNVTAYSKITTNIITTKIIDNFNSLQGSFSSFPKTLTGEAKLSSTRYQSDKSSLKLSYNFNTDDSVKGAYFDYTEPLIMPNNLKELGVWIYNPTKNSNNIKSQYIDSDGSKNVAILVEQMDWTGWKYITYKSPAKIKQIISIYVAQSDVPSKNISYIFIDDVTVKYAEDFSSTIELPKNISKTDKQNLSTPIENSFNISIVDNVKSPSTLFEKIRNDKLAKSLNKNSDVVIFNSNSVDSQLSSNITKEKLLHNGYSKKEISTGTIIFVSAKNSGIRTTDSASWTTLINDLSKANSNIFLMLDNTLDSFSDKQERQLLLDLLVEKQKSTNKNIWIICQSSSNSNSNYNGVKILNIGNSNLKTISDSVDNYKYLSISISETNVTYDFKNIF